ncbi:MAG: hydroxymethylglutaryl-CoA reductase, degradative [Myxococcales bacterium]|nr:hydroxymethylglutaryl-CoA reductase, degradative [Myxococcales bacterium]MCB9543200.1 hydroxymethylglutaryl-CoA reductase, degradative [Myxococcales bacterium]
MSRIPGFYRLDLEARHRELAERFGLDAADLAVLRDGGSLCWTRADKMVENCVGVFGVPLGLGLNFTINGRDYAVPMAVEEPSVVAAVSNMARLVHAHGGFGADADEGVMISQVQIVDVPDPTAACDALARARSRILARANAVHPNMAARGGGARDIEVRRFDAPHPMIVLHLLVDCVDAMGANAVNAMAEGVADLCEQLTGGRVCLRILSNLADRRRARAWCAVPEEALAGRGFTGAEVADGIVQAWRFAAVDPYRAATHNKGVMNGIDAVALATGNDWRSVEAGAHAYAARDGRYGSLTEWWREGGRLHGRIELPMAVGTVGGSTRVHPAVRVCRKILGVESARELAMVMAAVGLAQNMGALKALASEGIQRGHMSLHARQAALAAGAEGELVDQIAARLIRLGDIKESTARAILDELGGPERREVS